jgi:adenosylcobinamide kinase/adenosylcobinamide-phosphate guanylyltransferase
VPLTLLLGGARSGKSAAAMRIAEESAAPVTYVATGEARDDEMAARIARHRAERPTGWSTVEEPRELLEAMLRVAPEHTLLVDCLTLWVSNLLEHGLDDDDVMERAAQGAKVAAGRAGRVIAVSNEVGSGLVPMSALGRRYRDLLGQVNGIWAAQAREAGILIAGRLLWLPLPEGDSR